MRRLAATLMSMLVLSGLVTAPALGSGDPGPFTTFIDRHGGTPQERTRLYKGHMGVLLTNGSNGLLYLQWRLMNGLEVGEATGGSLNASCCDIGSGTGPGDGTYAWSAATQLVPSASPMSGWVPTELRGPDYTWIPNCFRDAFNSAADTLKDRVARFGGRSPAVEAWLATQNAVFAACSDPNATLPAPMTNAPAWLKADRAYQEAAFALYKGQNQDAFARFQAIARDPKSPWAPKGLYLSARAMHREALAHPSPQAFAAARAAIAPLQARPDAYGYGEVHAMLRALAYRDHPDLLFKKLDEELSAKAPVSDLAKGLRDYVTLSAKFSPHPDLADWLQTLRVYDREPALAHATERWTATGKTHWLILALALVRSGDMQAARLAEAAGALPKSDPAWLTAQYHQMRLGFATGDPAALRARVDAILASDLSGSDRNLFLALRTQLATSLPDLMRFALRTPFCSEGPEYCSGADWILADDRLAKSATGDKLVALGPETEAILDRLPLRSRMAASAGLPQELRLDLALTNYGRAVQLQDNVAIDRLAGELAILLPEVRHDWLTIRGTRPGPAKRFAEAFVLAKIPGVAPDLATYTRPQGTLHEWQGHWWDWMILPRAATVAIDPPIPSQYNGWSYWDGAADTDSDLVCYGYCGSGDFALRLPRFAAALQPMAQAERNRLLFYNDEDKTKLPSGSIAAWTSLLDYAQAHPRDPRSPEALYWLIRITHWGRAHDRVGYRAFRLLHTRYPGSTWTQRSPYYYD
jgi:hypothetical protein